jgi:hypothetical protein
MPALDRQGGQGEGPDNDGFESGGESQPPDISSDGDSDENEEDLVQFLLDLEEDEAEGDEAPVGWEEVVGPMEVEVDDFDPGIDHPGPRHNLDHQSKSLEFFQLFFDDIFLKLFIMKLLVL